MGLRNIRGGVVVIIMGMLGLVYGLAGKISMFVKIPIVIFSICLIIFGVFIEHPVMEFLRTQDKSDEMGSHFDQR